MLYTVAQESGVFMEQDTEGDVCEHCGEPCGVEYITDERIAVCNECNANIKADMDDDND